MFVAVKLAPNQNEFVDAFANDLVEVQIFTKSATKEIQDFDELLHVKTTKNFFVDLKILVEEN